ncbi:hypothetical protein BBJ29_008501 [Phytophthora kernoviae]|uniref:Uncharacterized protein n=1 Tax=Phytophthora kernoviae TaxID=325452 RepID=A0A3F2RKT8_9STRA|nr:hypothetical protein BBP00_00006527 [Phytophthora kernoviae]RLN71871.1 hypothetical protein BBJ29_008501 [Phytophthora kernoviae]
MADRPGDDAAKEHAPANAASVLDQSLSTSTATATGNSSAADSSESWGCRTSSFNINDRAEESDALTPKKSVEPTHADASELDDLRLELAHVQRDLEEERIDHDVNNANDAAIDAPTGEIGAVEYQDRRKQRQQLHAQRLDRAIGQRDLARECVAKQQAAVTTLESELRETVELLEEAQQAQAYCAHYARELHVLKRQIENTSVKLNEVRFGAQRNESRLDIATEYISQRIAESKLIKASQLANSMSVEFLVVSVAFHATFSCGWLAY